MLKQLFIIIPLAAFFSSCTIEQNYYIKKDQSGHYELKMNLSEMLTAIPDSIKKVRDTNPVKEYLVEGVLERVESYEGVSNFGYLHNGENYQFSFDFSHVNEVQKFSEGDSLINEVFKVIRYERVGKKKLEINVSSIDGIGTNSFDVYKQFGSMSSFIDVKINFYFEEEIKSLNSDLAVFDELNNALVYNFPLSDLLNAEIEGVSSIKFR